MSTRATPIAVAVCFAATILTTAAVAAYQTLSPAAIEEALRLSRTRRSADLEAFTAPYIVVTGGPGQPKVEVITEFRRAVMLGLEQASLGNYTWSPTNLTRAVAKYEGLTTVRAEVWLSPAHLYVGTPSYRMDLYDARHRIVMPVEEKRDPIFSAVTGAGETSSMTGVTLETIYRDAALREAGCCLVMILDPKAALVVEKQVEFAALR
jgi:hypothetical protein